jgi:protein-tyrosine phosphatase
MGYGRSATLAVSILVLRGLAPDIRTAEKQLRQVRPGVRLNGSQRLLLRRVHEVSQ